MAEVEQLSLELTAALANSEAEQLARPLVDPRTIPTRHSLLKQMALSPAHYFEACQAPQDDSLVERLGRGFAYDPHDPNQAFRIGRAIHAILVGGRITVYTGQRNPRAKAWIAFQEEAAAAGYHEIVNPREHAIVVGVTESIKRHELATKLLFDGTIRETRIDWEFCGKACRATPDARIPRTHVTDLKSAVSSEPATFARQARRLYYHAQAELYVEAIDRAGEGRPADAYVIAVEKKRPYPVTVFRFTEELLELGGKLNRLWIERLKNCESSNVWPVYAPPPAIVDLGLPEETFFAGLEVNGQQLEP